MNRVASSAHRFFYTALAASVFAYLIVVVSTYARMSEQQESCPEWRHCLIRPVAGTAVTPDYRDRPWEQRVHPFLALALALVVLRLAYLGWQPDPRRLTQHFFIPVIVLLLLSTLVWPDFVRANATAWTWARMSQIVGGLTILAFLWWLVMREQQLWQSVTDTSETRALRPRALAALTVVVAQAALGAWSSVNQIGVPCTEFPVCHGSWWPSMDFAEGFSVSRFTGTLGPDGATAIHMAHRAGALIALLYIGWLGLHVFWSVDAKLCRYGLLLTVLLLAEVSLGIMMTVGAPLLVAAIAHSAIGTLLLLSVLTLYHVVRPPRAVSIKTTKPA